MDSLTLAWVLAGLAALACAGLLVRVATEGSRTLALRSEGEEQRKQLRALQKQLDHGAKVLRQREAEVDRLTREAAKARKQVAASRGGRSDRSKAGARLAQLEQEALASAEEIARLREEVERARAASGAADERVARTRDEIEARAARERIALSETTQASEEKARALEARLLAAESARAEPEARAKKAEAEVARLKEKVRTQEMLYVSIRGELAARKDEVKQQREELERLRAYKVALAEPLASDLGGSAGAEDGAPPATTD